MEKNLLHVCSTDESISESVIVNACSTDESEKKGSYKCQYERCRRHNEQNKG